MKFQPSPRNLVGSVEDLRAGGRWFEPPLGQYCLQGLMIVIATGLVLLLPLSVVSTVVMLEISQWVGKSWLKELQENMDRCTGRRDITEITLKTAFNTIQAINHEI